MIYFMIFAIIILVAITLALSFLQVHLSRKKSKWPGLILPMFFILLSLVWTLTSYTRYLNADPFSNTQSNAEYDENGNIVEKIEKIDRDNTVEHTINYNSSSFISGIGVLFTLTAMNIPSIIFLFIYGISREKMRSKLEMQKMAIQDLN